MNTKPMTTLVEGTVEIVQQCEWYDPPHVAIHFSYKVAPVPVINVDYDPQSGRMVETPAGICDRENGCVTVPACDINVGDRIAVVKL